MSERETPKHAIQCPVCRSADITNLGGSLRCKCNSCNVAFGTLGGRTESMTDWVSESMSRLVEEKNRRIEELEERIRHKDETIEAQEEEIDIRGVLLNRVAKATGEGAWQDAVEAVERMAKERKEPDPDRPHIPTLRAVADALKAAGDGHSFRVRCRIGESIKRLEGDDGRE